MKRTVVIKRITDFLLLLVFGAAVPGNPYELNWWLWFVALCAALQARDIATRSGYYDEVISLIAGMKRGNL